MIPNRIGHQGWPLPAWVRWPMTFPIAQMRLVREAPGVMMRGSPVLTSKSSVNLTAVAPSWGAQVVVPILQQGRQLGGQPTLPVVASSGCSTGSGCRWGGASGTVSSIR